MRKVILSIAVTAVLWFVMFSPWTASFLNFWIAMSCSAVLLGGMSLTFGKGLQRHLSVNVKDIAIGVGSAALLWGIFYLGNWLSLMMFDFADHQVNSIYGMKSGINPTWIGVALLMLIGPAEEIFWRGYIQQTLEEKRGKWSALGTASIIYALVHIWSFNFMLIMAALVCGVFWGLLYCFNKNLLTVIISHAVWDVAIFLWFPIV